MKKEQFTKKKPIIKSNETDKKFPAIAYSTLDLSSKVVLRDGKKKSIESIHQLCDSKQTSFVETLNHMLNGSIGCGILGMGIAFKHGGLLFASILLTYTTVIAAYNQFILVSLADKFQYKYDYQTLTLTDTVGAAFDEGPLFYKKIATLVRKSIIFFVFMAQIGCCCIYLLYISQSLEQILSCYDIKVNLHVLMIATLPIVLASSLIRHMKHIGPVSIIANVSTFAALALILYSSFTDLPSITERKMIGTWDRLPLSFGTTIFAMEGIAVTLPVQQNMKRKSDFNGVCGVLSVTMIVVVSLTMLVGVFGYWKYGENVKDSVTLNLELKNDLLAQSVILFMMIGILCTYALQLFVPISLILEYVDNRTSKWPCSEYHVYEYALRTFLVLLTFLIAEGMPYLNLITSLIGAVSGSFIGFIYCPIADMITREKKECGRFYWRRILCIISLITGLIAFFFGTATSFKELTEAVKKDLSAK